MSATGRSSGYERDPEDWFETPAWAVEAIVPHLPAAGRVLDPGCGTGAILRVLSKTPPFKAENLFGIEINTRRATEARRQFYVDTADFLKSTDAWDLIIGNPPYKLSLEFAEKAIALTKPRRGTVALLLRLNWLSSLDRVTFHGQNPSDVHVLPRRPSFCVSVKCKKACGWFATMSPEADRPKACPKCFAAVSITTTDACEYGWFVFGPGRGNRWLILGSDNGE